MIHHEPGEPNESIWPPSVPVREVLSKRPLYVETYSRIGLMGKRYYWRTNHKSNNLTMAQGQAYKTVEARDHAVDVLWPDLVVDPLG